MEESTRFKSDPYNPTNRLLTMQGVRDVFLSMNLNPPPIENLATYQKACIHKSYTPLKDYEEFVRPKECLPLQSVSYETMEFLGDSLLGSIISTYLYERYVENFKVDEGFLTKLKIRFVCGEQLGYLSEQLGFAKWMVISKHIDEQCEGRQNVHILEDIYEAFLGAIYLDTQDLAYVRDFVIRSIETHVDIADLISKDNNYKDQILRYFQHNFKVHPIYQTIKDEVRDTFVCSLLKDSECIAKASATTKKKAEQEASKQALLIYHVIS
jgi:ribonuclease-3